MKNKSSFTVRQEREAEFPAIYELIRTAFATAEVSDGDEQDFANRLRIHGNYIPELALVAECQGKLIGHIMLTRTVVTQDDGTPYEALMIAPLSVVLDYRNQGVGSALLKEGLRLAQSRVTGQLFFAAILLRTFRFQSDRRIRYPASRSAGRISALFYGPRTDSG